MAKGSSHHPSCGKYGTSNPGECLIGTNDCLRCGQIGHFLNAWPMGRHNYESHKVEASFLASASRVPHKGSTSRISEGTNGLYSMASR